MAAKEKIIGGHRGIYDQFPRKGGAAITATHYCPGCGHGILHKLIGEATADLDIQDRCVVMNPVGCSVFAYYYLDCGHVQVAHGRAPAVATGVSRAEDDAIAISYQGDGDLASIGLDRDHPGRQPRREAGCILHQQLGLWHDRRPDGANDPHRRGDGYNTQGARSKGHWLSYPHVRAPGHLEGPCLRRAVSLSDIDHIRTARRAVRKALQIQKEKKGYTFVEFLSPAPPS